MIQSPQKKHLIESIIDFDCDSSNVLESMYENNPNVTICKALAEGWFITRSRYLVELLTNNDYKDKICQAFVPKILSAFKTCLHWINPSVLRQENIMQTLIGILTIPDVPMKILAVDCLHILFTRTYTQPEDFDFSLALCLPVKA